MRTGVTGTNVDSLAPIADARHAVNDQTRTTAIARPAANHMTERMRNVTMKTPRSVEHPEVRMLGTVGI
jgi:hypothetical protein